MDPAGDVSVIAPVYGNAETLPALHRRIISALDGGLREIVFVDDGSPDDSYEVMRALSERDCRVRAIRRPRNGGQHLAVLQGLRQSRGEWSVVMDADLQDPPEAIPLLLSTARDGHDVVFAGRRGRYEPRLRLASSRLFKRTLAAATGLPPDAGMFFAASRRAVERVLEMDGPPPFVVAMIGRAELTTASVPVERSPALGRSGYSPVDRMRSASRGLRWAIQPRLGAAPAAGSSIERHNRLQREYYSRPKRGMAPRVSRYLERHLDELLEFAGIGVGARVLEVGAGQGRYTVPLFDRGFAVEALDLSATMLGHLRDAAGERDIPIHHGDVLVPPASVGADYDAVVALFAVHHMHSFGLCIQSMSRLLKPGGRLAFLEPNPYNPLYYLQMAIRPSMTWSGDKGMLGMRPRPLLGAMSAAGLTDVRFRRFGFFPPAIADRPGAARLERAIESLSPLRPILPFQLVGGRTGVP
jgi:glycosyltransferase involved in cell wall biosynthesis